MIDNTSEQIKKFRIEKIGQYNKEIKKEKQMIIASKIGIATNVLAIYLVSIGNSLQQENYFESISEELRNIVVTSLCLFSGSFFVTTMLNSINKKTMFEGKIEDIQNSLEELEITEKCKRKHL